eukprot:IDg3573t1
MDPRKALATDSQRINDSDEDDAVVDFHMQRSREEDDEALTAAAGLRGLRVRISYLREEFQNATDNVQESVRANIYAYVFVPKGDALATPGIHLLQRITAALRMMAYGATENAVVKFCRLSESSAMESMKEFTKGVAEKDGAEYLRSLMT